MKNLHLLFLSEKSVHLTTLTPTLHSKNVSPCLYLKNVIRGCPVDGTYTINRASFPFVKFLFLKTFEFVTHDLDHVQ